MFTTDPAGNTNGYTYDPLYGVRQVTAPNGSVTVFAYDPVGNLLSVTAPNNEVTGFKYTSRNQVSQRTDPLGNADQFPTYDADGNLKTHIDRNGNTLAYQYDEQDRLHLATYTNASTGGVEASDTFTWDARNRLSQVQEVTASGSATISRSYNGLDLLAAETTPVGQIIYTYDLAGRPQTTSGTDYPRTTYTFDSGNRLDTVVQNGQTVSIQYDNANRRHILTLQNGLLLTYGFDAASELTSLSYTNPSTATTVGTLSYGYDLTGRQNARSGSLFQSVLPQPVSLATYNADNQIATWQGTPFSYDRNGNLTSDGINSYQWDTRNRLLVTAGGTAQFGYDPLGRRQSAAVPATGSGVGTFLYDHGNQAVKLFPPNFVATVFNGLDTDERFGRFNAQGHIFLVDALGSTIAQTDATGAVQTSYGYDPFGNTTTTGTSDTNPFQFAGRENDGTGLYYYRARYYSPTYGRFISEDPTGFAGGSLNLYAYANNDPINLIDPLGLSSTSGPQNITQLLGLILATEAAGLGPEDPAADAAVLGEIAAYEGGAFAAANTVRTLTAADLGVNAGALTQLSGTVSTAGANVTVTIGMIEGSITNPFGVISSLSSMASAQGASSLTVEASIANPALLNILGRVDGFHQHQPARKTDDG